MAIITRFQTNTRGALYQAGNTLGLSGNNGQPAAIGNVGGFITTSTTLPTPTGWEAIVNVANEENITLNWQQNSSSANVNLPTGASVLYAELIWASDIRNETLDLSAVQNTSVALTAPDGSTILVAPDPITSQTVTMPGPITYMTRSNNVTSIIQQKGNGKYTVSGVPAARGGTSTCCVGWTLVMAYSLSSQPYRSLNIYTACEGISGTISATLTVTGFSTPRSGTVLARALIGGLEGDSNGSGDQALFGSNTSSLIALSGPQNPQSNFFQAQICDNTGNLDRSGTFGNRNQPLGSLASGVRQGWDITNVDANGILPNNQTSAVFRFSSTSEVYAANMVALQINVDSADLSSINKGGDKSVVLLNDVLAYTITIPNTGTTTATNIIFIDTVPNGTSFVPGSVTINGISDVIANPKNPGFSIPDIGAGGVSTVSFKVTIDTVPIPNPIPNNCFVTYKFLPGIASTIPVSSYNESNVFNVTYIEPRLSSAKYVDKNYANIGDILTYTIPIQNTGTATANSILFLDTIPSGTSLVVGSLKQDGVNISGTTNSPGVTLPNGLAIGGTTTVSFQVTITMLPSPNPIPNIATVIGRFILDATTSPNRIITSTTYTNRVTTQVNTASIVNPTKTVDKAYATCGDTISYLIQFKNSGSTTALNVVLKDTIPSGTALVPNSVLINGVQQMGANPGSGINIGSIAPNATVSVFFSVAVQC